MASRNKPRKSPTSILVDANDLAREFYRLMGYQAPYGYLFHKATHPQEAMCWAFAAAAYERLAATDLDEVVAECEDGPCPRCASRTCTRARST